MQIYSKTALAALALAISCSPVLAQGEPQDPPAEQHGGREGHGPRGPMWDKKLGEERGEWGQRRGSYGRGERMGRRGFGRGQREFGLARLLKNPAIRQQLGITTEQAATIRQQESDFRKAEIRGRADLQVKRIDLESLLDADKPDRAAIDSKLQEISAARLEQEKTAVHYRLAMRDAITPTQREKLHQLMSDRRRHAGGPAHSGPQRVGRRDLHGPAAAPNPQVQPKN